MLTDGQNERARLRELFSLRILDTPPEARFDRYTRLVADVFGVPVALISLIDDKRQWFKSAVGWSVRETPKDIAFCAYALSHELMEVPDALADAWCRHNPLVSGPPFIRFYAGAVLRGPTGQPLGTLCLIDYRPRTLSDVERGRLQAFARLVEQEINFNARLENARDALRRVAFHDPVTGLPERCVIEEHLERMLPEAARNRRSVAAVHLHMVDFDDIIAIRGQAAANLLLQEVAARLASTTAVVGRLSAGRFLLVMPGLRDRSDASSGVRRVIKALSHPIENLSRPLKLALGISSYPEDADSVDALLDCARTASLRLTAEAEPAPFQFYSRDNHAWAARRDDMAQRLACALDHRQLRLAYQPIVALDGGRVVSLEALTRWTDDRYGEVSPAEFMPIAEEDADLCRALMQWTLGTACRQTAAWNGRLGTQVRAVVNVPGCELHRCEFPELVHSALRQSGLPATRLTLELTEQSLIADVDAAVATMHKLRNDGVHFALDDFGTGYSSLNYLRRLPLDALKIDRSFTASAADDAVARNLTRGIVDIARALGLAAVAEGIENVAQLEALRTLGCDFGQGYLFSRPGTAYEMSRLLTSPTGLLPAKAAACRSKKDNPSAAYPAGLGIRISAAQPPEYNP